MKLASYCRWTRLQNDTTAPVSCAKTIMSTIPWWGIWWVWSFLDIYKAICCFQYDCRWILACQEVIWWTQHHSCERTQDICSRTCPAGIGGWPLQALPALCQKVCSQCSLHQWEISIRPRLSWYVICLFICLACCSLLTVYVNCRFRQSSTSKEDKFFLRFGTGKPILNPTKEVDELQNEFKLPSICSSNARHVIETLKGTKGLDAAESAGIA